MSTNNTDNILQVKDPGTMGNELLSVPGFVKELKNYTLAVSPRPNQPLGRQSSPFIIVSCLRVSASPDVPERIQTIVEYAKTLHLRCRG